MKKREEVQPDGEVKLNGILEEFRQALREEIDQIKKDGQSSTLLYGGREIKHNQENYWYEFRVEYVPSIPADTPCRLILGKDHFEVDVIGFDGNIITLSSKVKLNPPFAKARLENGSTVLLEALIKCIEANAEKNNPAGNRMLSVNGMQCEPSEKIYSYNDVVRRNETDSQYEAVMSALTNNISYIWGPPGTGKTTVIGRIIEELFNRGRSVLVVSHTNTAVDGAISKAAKFCPWDEGKPYPILRIGKQDPKQNWPAGVSMREHMALLGEELYKKKKELQHIESNLRTQLADKSMKLSKVNWVTYSNLELVHEHLKEISDYNTEYSKQKSVIDKIEHNIENEKANHPEVKNFYKLTSTLKAKEPELAANEEYIKSLEAAIEKTTETTLKAKDELKKHSVYNALSEKTSQFMPEHFIKSQIESLDDELQVLNTELDAEEKNKETSEALIIAYEKKNKLSKFFTNKDSVIKAENQIKAANENIPKIKEKIQRQQNVKDEYKRQLSELLVIKDQMAAVTPSKLPEYWEKIIVETEHKKKVTEKMLRDAEAIYEALKSEIDKLRKDANIARTTMDTLRRLKENLRQATARLDKILTSINTLKNDCSEILANECRLCSAFFTVDTKIADKELLKVLSKELEAIEKETVGYDAELLQNDIDNLKERLNDIFKLLAEIEEQIKALEKYVIFNAKIVGATLTKTYLSDALRMRTFDTVILDEASMASIPALWCASYLAEKNVVIVGDFLQLPPIVMSDKPYAKKWLGQDIFFHSGIQEKAKKGNYKPNNFIMLDEQFRMEKRIADIANIYYSEYSSLKSDDSNPYRIKDRKKFYDWYSGNPKENCIRLIDTGSLHAWVSGIAQGRGHSRLNCFSAAVDVDLAFKCVEKKLKQISPDCNYRSKDPAVLIVAPYKPHVNLINKLIDSAYERRGLDNLNLIQAGTVHSFQGKEADIVIFDLVIDEPHWKANLFMKDKEVNEDLRKMFNVAVTRAKFKLFMVGNFEYCMRRAKDNALSQMLNYLIKDQKLPKEDAKKLLPNLVFSPPANTIDKVDFNKYDILCNEGNFYPYFINDIEQLKQNGKLIIYSPFITENRLEYLMPYLVDALNRNCQIIVVTKAISERSRSEITQYKKCEDELHKIGVQILHKQGMHEKLIFVDDVAVWTGSLNALSSNGNTGELMERRTGGQVIEVYKKFLDIEHLSSAGKNKQELGCPICGGEMLIKESDNGGFYWQCINGDYSRSAEQQYPYDGVLRCKCGAPYVFAMKTVPRWQCSENPKHYQNVRIGDLKLEKMRELIPTEKELMAVEKYFADKNKDKSKMKSANVDVKPASEYGEAVQLSLF